MMQRRSAIAGWCGVYRASSLVAIRAIKGVAGDDPALSTVLVKILGWQSAHPLNP
jgi:hypothetical protein